MLETHAVGTLPVPHRHGEGRELTGAMTKRAHVDPMIVFGQVHRLGKQQRPKNRIAQGADANRRCTANVRLPEWRLKERLQIDQNRILAVGDDVFGVQIGPAKHIGERRVNPLTEEVTIDFIPSVTRRGCDELHPAILALIVGANPFEVRLAAPAVEPGNAIEEDLFERDRARFVDEALAGREGKHIHRSTAAVRVAVGAHRHQRSGIAAAEEIPPQHRACCVEPRQHGNCRHLPVVGDGGKAAHQNRILLQQSAREGAVGQAIAEKAITLLRRAAGKELAAARDRELKNQRLGDASQQPPAQTKRQRINQRGAFVLADGRKRR